MLVHVQRAAFCWCVFVSTVWATGAEEVPLMGLERDLISHASGVSSIDDWSDIVSQWIESRSSSISRDDLKMLVRAKREAIASIRLTYTQQSKLNGREITQQLQRVEFASSGNKLLRRTSVGERPDHQWDASDAYNGTRVGHIRHNRNQKRGALPITNISHFQGRSEFFDTDDPLATAMLLDSVADLGHQWLPYDLSALLETPGVVVYDEVRPDTGQVVTVVSLPVPAVYKVYLDPLKDFSVYRYEEYKVEYEDGIPRSRTLRIARSSEDLVSYGNGLWLPRRAVTQWHDLETGLVSTEREVLLESVVVNKPIADATFQLVFPPGAKVFDSTAQLQFDMPSVSISSLDESLAEAASTPNSFAARESSKSDTVRSEIVEPSSQYEDDRQNSIIVFACVLVASIILAIGAIIVFRRRRLEKV